MYDIIPITNLLNDMLLNIICISECFWSQAKCANIYLDQSLGRQILLASEVVVLVGILLSFESIVKYTVQQYVFSGLIMFVAAEVLEGNNISLNMTNSIIDIYLIISHGMITGVNLSLLSRVMSSRLSRGTYNGGLLSTEAGTFARVVADATITLGGYAERKHLLNLTLLPSLVICICSIVATCCTYNSLY